MMFFTKPEKVYSRDTLPTFFVNNNKKSIFNPTAKEVRLSRFVVISFLLLVSLSALKEARAGNIRGTVRDGKTGETLVGAQLLIQGTTRGTITDFDGNFVLADVTKGSYNLVVAFISYENQIIKVEVPEVGDAELVIDLLPVSIDVGEVKVVARKRSNTEVALMNTLKSGSLIVSGITAQQISRS